MTSRATRTWHITPEEADCIAFHAELDAYLDDGGIGGLLDAACEVAGSMIEMDPKRAFAVAELTGTRDELLVDYDDASRAIRIWFALMAEPGARH
jgi:hypothetical protein